MIIKKNFWNMGSGIKMILNRNSSKKKRLVIDLYNQGKTTRAIAKDKNFFPDGAELKRLYSEPKNRQAIRKTSLLTGIYYHLFMES
jgi:hypothetical protein